MDAAADHNAVSNAHGHKTCTEMLKSGLLAGRAGEPIPTNMLPELTKRHIKNHASASGNVGSSKPCSSSLTKERQRILLEEEPPWTIYQSRRHQETSVEREAAFVASSQFLSSPLIYISFMVI